MPSNDFVSLSEAGPVAIATMGPVRLSRNGAEPPAPELPAPELPTPDTPGCGCAIWWAASMRRKCSAASCGVEYEISIRVTSPLDLLFRHPRLQIQRVGAAGG